MPDLSFVLPGDPETLTGGYLYDQTICQGLRERGWRVDIVRLADAFPFPDQAALDNANAALGAVPDGRLVVIDGLALGAMPTVAEQHETRLNLVGLVHHPLAEETGLSDSQAQSLLMSERRALAAVRRVIVTSPHTARGLADYDVAAEDISVVRPGTEPPSVSEASKVSSLSGPGLSLLCVATLTPRKGHAVLFEALSGLRDRDWHLTCIGDQALDPPTTERLGRQLGDLGLEGRVALIDALPPAALPAYYQAADLLVHASYHEGYGMALAEALAYGLPIVSTTAGAIPDTVPESAGLLVPPGDAAALRTALARYLDEPSLRNSLAEGARIAGAALPSWQDSIEAFESVLLQVSE